MSTFKSRTLAIPVSTRHFVAPCAVLSAILLATNPIQAAAVRFDDTSPAEVIVVTANDFEGGFFVNGLLVQQGLNSPGSITLPETGPLDFFGQWSVLTIPAPIDRTIYLIEPGGDPTTPPLISDIFRFNIHTDPGPNGFVSTIQGTFVSDINGELGSLPSGVSPNDVFVEDGNPVLFSALNLTGALISDVPEPSSWVLLGSALVGFCGYRIRKRFA